MDTKQADNCKVTVLESAPCAVMLSVEVPHLDVVSEADKVFDGIQKVAQVPGFRAGKAPLAMVKKSFAGKAREQVIENLIHRTVMGALQSQGVDPIDTPSIEKISFDFDKPFSYTLKAERHPEVKPRDYKGIKITREIRPVTDAMVNEQLDALRERNARIEAATTDTVAHTHMVQIDYACSSDGQPLKDLTTKNYMMDLSAHQILPGLREGLLGAKKGQTLDIPVTFPADYPGKNLAGKNVLFKVTVNEIKEKILPPADDELGKDMGFEKLADLVAKIRESLEAEEKKRQDQEVEKQIIAHLVAGNTFPIPVSLVEEQLAHMWERTLEYFKQRGVNRLNLDKEKDEWRAKYRAEAENNVRLSYILNAIAATEKLEVTDDDLAKELERLTAANPGRDADVKKYFDENRAKIRVTMREEKIFSFLLSNGKIKEETKKQS